MRHVKYWYAMSKLILRHNGLSEDAIEKLSKPNRAALFKAVTWPRFLKSILVRKAMDRHWREQLEETHACAFRPTFLGKQEFGDEDISALLTTLNFPGTLPEVRNFMAAMHPPCFAL